MNVTQAQAQRLKALFPGRDRCVGRTQGDKVWTEAEAVDQLGLYEGHLSGRRDTGLAPILQDNTAHWGALDYDAHEDHPVDHAAVARDVARKGLPFVVARSRSGGAHLYLFLTRSTSAVAVKGALKALASHVDLQSYNKQGEVKDVEIFPKQARVRPKDKASWIRLPYYGGVRVAFDDEGEPCDVDGFLDLAESRRTDPAALVELVGRLNGKQRKQRDASPGYDAAGRNAWLFRWGVKAAEDHPDDWEALTREYARTNCPHGNDLSEHEVDTIIDNIKRRIESGKTTAGKEDRTDVGNARRFAKQHDSRARYVNLWGTWLVWDGKRWRVDETQRHMNLAKQTAKSIWREVAAATDVRAQDALSKWAVRSHSRAALSNMVALAQSEEALVGEPDQFDQNEWVMNVANGTLDLDPVTGAVRRREHRQVDMLTKVCRASYEPNAKADRWRRFIDEITGGDAELADYMQRIAGYVLTGNVSERIIILLLGFNGNNGKTLFLRTLAWVLGDYAQKVRVETLTEMMAGKIRNDLADLVSKRFVWASELTDSMKLDVALLKEMTGDEPHRARWLFKEHFDYMPQYTPFVATNRRPKLPIGDDPGFWRRMRVLPFNQVFEGARCDPDLFNHFKRDEADGILTWAAEGFTRWTQEGLTVPRSVAEATDDWRQDADRVGRFVEECADVGETLQEVRQRVFTLYTAWCKVEGFKPISQQAFNKELKNKGFVADTQRIDGKATKIWQGLTLKTVQAMSPELVAELSKLDTTADDIENNPGANEV